MLVEYLISNIPLFSVSAVMLFIAIRNLRVRMKESVYFIVFTAIVLFLSVVVTMETYSKATGNVIVGTLFTSLGYILRPVLLYIFVLLANMDYKRSDKFYIFTCLPLVFNFFVYLLPLFFGVEGVSTVVFSYQMNADGTASFVRGGFLNYVSHAVCVFYLGLLFYVSTIRFYGKHRRDSLVLSLCVIIILATVTAEMLTHRNDLLNIVCEICAMINYIFIISVNSSRDALTNLYDRKTFYEDVSKYEKNINGIIQIDMNELKYLNDNFGHDVGDEALTELANIFSSAIDNNTMCAYRLSGDEFVVLMFQGKKEVLEKTVSSIKEELDKSSFSAAIGYCYYERRIDRMSFHDAMKKAETLMYEDKKRHYIDSGHDRRQ